MSLGRSIFGVAFILGACSLSLDESLIDGGTGGTKPDASLGGKGGTDASTDAKSDAGSGGTGATDGGGKGGTGGTGNTGGKGGSGGTGGTGGTTAGKVDCGTNICAIAQTYCCAVLDPEAGTLDSQCTSATSCSGTKISCDGVEDCNTGLLCCFDSPNLGSGDVHCLTTCPNSSTTGVQQFCTGDAECTAGTCQPISGVLTQYIPSGYKTCQ